MKFIPINRPSLGIEEKEAVDEVLRSGILTDASMEGGKWVRSFESKLRSLLGVKHVIAVNSGTAALHASLVACGVGEGDEVILPSFTFVATANVVLSCGARPIFADTKADYNIDPREVKKRITKRTRAIIPVDIYGYPSDLDELKEIGEQHDIPLIEDAAESLGATYKGRQTGSTVKAGCFSLYATKVITSGEGGAISTNDEEFAENLRMVRNHGMVHGNDTRVLGLNLRLPEVSAAIASVQMDKLGSFLGTRRRNVRSLVDQIADIRGLGMTQDAPDRTHTWYLFTVNVRRKRDEMLAKLRKASIGAAVYWSTPVHKTPFYVESGYSKTRLPNTEESAKRVLSLPVHPEVTSKEIAYIGDSLREIKAELG
jgi:dTDP-4-amino-4,6-dideoxygalactose transaminase